MIKKLPILSICSLIVVALFLVVSTSRAQTNNANAADIKFTTFSVREFRQQAAPVVRKMYVQKGRRPTGGNVRDSVFTNHGFSWEAPEDGGFLRVGKRFTDSSRYYGWFFYYRWIYSSPEVRYYIFSTSALRKPATYLTLRGEVKTSTYFGNAGNSLTQQITALKTNIAASDLGITPPGLGDLVFNQTSGPETILNGRTVRQIVMYADSAMTLGNRQRTVYPMSLINLLNTVVGRINNEFTSPLVDTVTTYPLVLKGNKSITAVSYLIYDTTRLSPWNRSRTTVRMNREEALTIATGYKLDQNYPNPFNPTTTISYQLASDSHVKLSIYDVAGREVAILVNDVQSAGQQYMDWNAENLTSGVYFYRLEAKGVSDASSFIQNKKMLLLK